MDKDMDLDKNKDINMNMNTLTLPKVTSKLPHHSIPAPYCCTKFYQTNTTEI